MLHRAVVFNLSPCNAITFAKQVAQRVILCEKQNRWSIHNIKLQKYCPVGVTGPIVSSFSYKIANVDEPVNHAVSYIFLCGRNVFFLCVLERLELRCNSMICSRPLILTLRKCRTTSCILCCGVSCLLLKQCSARAAKLSRDILEISAS